MSSLLAEMLRRQVSAETAARVVLACLQTQRELRPECDWLIVEDFGGTGRTVLVPELPALNPAVYDAWPWSGLAGYQRTGRELRALGLAKPEAR